MGCCAAAAGVIQSRRRLAVEAGMGVRRPRVTLLLHRPRGQPPPQVAGAPLLPHCPSTQGLLVLFMYHTPLWKASL